ncbi:MAG TPA: Mor transcription activator family protein [Candidatus Ozemobacteraceae bacterium]|nr:Mor transcription activator family protein [Candidatus Ozemobacteraceae bacterium]
MANKTDVPLYPELLSDLSDQFKELLLEKGMSEEEAAKLAFDLVEFVRNHWGGMLIYIPSGKRYELSLRDKQIVEEFDGSNWMKLCTEHGISRPHLYRIVAASRPPIGVQHALPFDNDDAESSE